MREIKKATNSLETRRIRKIRNEEAKLGISPNSDSETEEVDLSKELYPLGHYINNREEMIEQMFAIIKGPKLKKMLPPILKDMPFDELKADCLIHLLGMSKKRIRAILDGKEIYSSSDSESHSDGSTTPSKKLKVDLKPFVIKQEGCSDISDNSEEVVLVEPDLDLTKITNSAGTKSSTTEDKKKSKRKLKRKELEEKHKRTKSKPKEEMSGSDEVLQIDSSEESPSGTEVEAEAPKEGKTLLEILELEMRARAIRALLKNNEPQEDEEPKTATEEPVENPVSSKEKQKKHVVEDSNNKVTPTKNFRKKKRKSDDVIVITPKVVTIDLTDENEESGKKQDKSQGISSNESPETSNLENNSVVENTMVVNSEGVSYSIENASELDVSDKTSESNHDKSSWAQRWLESKEVKKVVSTSKICGNIRKKIKSAKLAQKQKPVQDKPEIESPATQTEIEGSVVEYKLLSKSTTVAGSEIDGVVDNDTQSSSISANQETESSEKELVQASTADQVQDVSSTRMESISCDVQDTSSDLQIIDQSTYEAVAESDAFTKDNPNNVRKVDMLLPTKGDEEKSEFQCLNETFDDICKNESAGDLVKTSDVLAKDVSGTEEQTLMTYDDKSKSNDIDSPSLCSHLISNNLSNSSCSSNNDFEPSEKSNDQNQKHGQSLKIDGKKFDNSQKEISVSEVSETLNNIVSACNEKSFEEQNELEALEINIGDEDRDIENVIEDIVIQTQSNNCIQDTIIID